MPSKINIGPLENFTPGQLHTITANGQTILLARLADGRVCALQNQCTHLPLPLNRGKLEGETLTCPWHNSQFNACTGENKDWVMGIAGITMPDWSRRLIALGRQPENLTTYKVEVEDNTVFVYL